VKSATLTFASTSTASRSLLQSQLVTCSLLQFLLTTADIVLVADPLYLSSDPLKYLTAKVPVISRSSHFSLRWNRAQYVVLHPSISSYQNFRHVLNYSSPSTNLFWLCVRSRHPWRVFLAFLENDGKHHIQLERPVMMIL
jgi:hypothetical protein